MVNGINLLSLFVVLLFQCEIEAIRLLLNEPSFECSSRYEFRHILDSHIPELQNCSIVGEMFPVCKKNITVALSIDPPYTILGENNEIKGLLPGMLKVALDACCHGCTTVTYLNVSGEIEKYFADNVDFILPHESATNSLHFGAYDFVPFIEVDGVTFLTKKSLRKSVNVSNHLLFAVLDTWPLFLTALLMALIAGCVVWVLDSWFNEEEFPLSFPRGPFEGFWWAFVSMTTVGYGDRAPKSVTGRLFAVIWIIIGITVFSMYTAALTTALTSEVDDQKENSLYAKEIGVLEGRAAGHGGAVLEHGHIKAYKTVDSLFRALQNEHVYAIGLDDNIASYYMSHYNDIVDGLILHHRIVFTGNAYGVLSYDKNISHFIKSFIDNNADNVDAITEEIRYTQKIAHMRFEKENSSGEVSFSELSEFFYITIGVLAAFGVVVCLIGLACKYVFKRNRECFETYYISCQDYKRKKKKTTDVDLSSQPSKEELQKLFTQELHEFKEKWVKILLQEPQTKDA